MGIKDNKKESIRVNSSKKDYPAICIKYLTNKKKYNFNYFKKNFRNKCEAYDELFKKIIQIQNMKWVEFANSGKSLGIEYIPIKILKIEIHEDLKNYEKFISIRFKEQDYRILAIKNNDYLHIIGFDLDYSAYNHGS